LAKIIYNIFMALKPLNPEIKKVLIRKHMFCSTIGIVCLVFSLILNLILVLSGGNSDKSG